MVPVTKFTGALLLAGASGNVIVVSLSGSVTAKTTSWASAVAPSSTIGLPPTSVPAACKDTGPEKKAEPLFVYSK